MPRVFGQVRDSRPCASSSFDRRRIAAPSRRAAAASCRSSACRRAPRSLPSRGTAAAASAAGSGSRRRRAACSMICRLVVSSSDGRSGRPPCGIVFRSTAQYSGVRPHQSHLFDVRALLNQVAPRRRSGTFSDRQSSGVTPSGSARLTSAPPSTSAFAHSRQPSRAAYSSGVSPPAGRYLRARLGGDLPLPVVHRRARVDVGAVLDQQLAPSPAGSAPPPTSARSARATAPRR